MRTNVIVGLYVAGLLSLGTAHANLIINGDFTNGDLKPWTTAADVAINNTAFGMDGNYAALGFNTEGGTNRLWQDFNVTGLDEIRVSFDWFFIFEVGGQRSQDVFVSLLRDFDNTTDNFNFNRLVTGKKPTTGTQFLSGTFSEVFDISGFSTAKARLQFKLTENLGDTYSSAGIDNVRVNPVPEPSSILLVGAGLAGLAFIGRRKTRKHADTVE